MEEGPVGPPVTPAAPAANASSIDLMINHAASQFNLDPDILRSLFMTESGLNPNAVGPGGELGIGQFTPQTAQAFGIDPRDPAQAIPAAAQYLRNNLNRFGGDYNSALAAYNWGPGNVAKFGVNAAPASTKAYVAKITGGRQPAAPTSRPAGQPAPDAAPPTPLAATVAPSPPSPTQQTAQNPWPPPGLAQPQGAGLPGAPTSLADAFAQAARTMTG
jgi:hypothetical protein